MKKSIGQKPPKCFFLTGVTYEEACTQAAIPGEWQSNWAALAAANILQRMIFTIYPPLPECHAGGSYNNCNQIFIPSSSTLSKLIGDDIYILWSSVLFDVKNISQTKPWRANHFVPLIPRTKLESCCGKEKKMIKRKKKVLNKENSYHVFSMNAAEKDGSCSSDRSVQTDMCKTRSNVIVLSDSEQSIAISNGTSPFRLEWPELGSSSPIVPFDDDEILADCHRTLREVVSILLCSKPASSEYGDLIYANRKSLFTLSICSSRLQAVATSPIKSRVTISHLIGQRSIASRTLEIADKYHSLLEFSV